MKTLLRTVIVAVLMTVGTLAMAQQPEKSPSDLKAEIAALQSKLSDQQAQQGTIAGKFAGFGEELGVAFNGFVTAMDGGMKVTTVRVNELAQTDVGRFAMVAIGWKIFAEDILSVGRSVFNKTAGLILLGVFCWLLKRTIEITCWGKMIVMKKEGPWYDRKVTKERSTPLLKVTGTNDTAELVFYIVSIVSLVVLFLSAVTGLCH